MLQSIMSMGVALVMMFVSFVPGFVLPENAKNKVDKTYPYVFVHGFLGWGKDEGIDEDLPYWGATSCNLMGNLSDKGYECFDASVGPLSSNWDRACELYAQITGTTVDYGVAHSKKCNHARYGRTYTEPMIDDWGKLDKNGLKNKINLIGHSFGGNTIRLLTELLANGSPEEVGVTRTNDISGLFTGGKGDYINSVVTICSPSNGTTLAYISEDLFLCQLLIGMSYTYAGIMGRSLLNGYFDFHLEQFGITNVPGEKNNRVLLGKALSVVLKQKNDNAVYDMSPDGAAELNKIIGMEKNIYYFSYAFSTTKPGSISGNQYPIPSTLPFLSPFATMMGAYKINRQTDFPIDETWRENDGLVNLVSAKYPLDDLHQEYDSKNIKPGIWNVMPVSIGDHGTAIGIGVSEDSTMKYYTDMVEMIERLPIKN